jgi:hypothetical protein
MRKNRLRKLNIRAHGVSSGRLLRATPEWLTWADENRA